MPEIVFALKWQISENDLLFLKDSGHGFLTSQSVTNIPGIHYNFECFPNFYYAMPNEQTKIFLYLDLKKVKNVEAYLTLKIDSANISKEIHLKFEKSERKACFECPTNEFFDAEKKFFVDGKLNLKFNGTIKFEEKNVIQIFDIGYGQQKWIGGELGDEFWGKEDTKDFKIITSDGKEIKVHKFILQNRSDVFTAMINSNMKEAIENKVEIPNFPFIVVETAFKLIYNCNFTTSFSMEELMQLLQFFDQYQIPILKAKIEPYLIDKISPSTIVRLINCSFQTNSSNLKKKCMEFLMVCIKQQTTLADIEILDKDILLETVKHFMYLNIETIGTKDL